jgi:hypothetical protein
MSVPTVPPKVTNGLLVTVNAPPEAVQAPEVPLRLMFPIKAGVVAATVEVLPILETV